MAVKLSSNSTTSEPFLRLVYSAPAAYESIGSKIHRFTLPATKSLPFVKVRANDQPFWRPESFWYVKSTGNREKDIQLGRKYARLAIAAMKADSDFHLVALVLQDIITDAIKKTGKKGCGLRCPILLGFLAEISYIIAAAT